MSEELDRIDVDKVIAHTQKVVDRMKTIAPFREGAFPRIGKQVVVGLEPLPEAGPGEVQVGEGNGPREITEFREAKIDFPFDDLVGVQPMVQPLGPKIVRSLRMQIAG
jgi:hypothetical protein